MRLQHDIQPNTSRTKGRLRSGLGQTMTEYALIIAAIAVVAWAAYNIMGQNIGTMASGIDSSLTSV